MITFVLLLITTTILIFIYLCGKYNENYWKKRNVTFDPRNKVTGVMWDYIVNDKAIFENLWDVYKRYPNEPAVGIGSFFTPTLYLIDPKNVQHVLVTDFNSFNHRGLDFSAGDFLADNVLFMSGNRWKLMRHKMTPLFTTAKLKSMYHIVDKSAVDFVEHLKSNEVLLKGDAFNTISSFCCGAFGAAVFGVSTESIFDSPFLYMTQNAFKSTLTRTIKVAASNLCNPLFNFFGVKFFKHYENLVLSAVKQLIKTREADGVKRNDFGDICVHLKSLGKIVDKETGLELEPTDELLAAQAFFFYTAGVEPVATVIFNTLVELGRNPKYLKLVEDEINAAFKEKDMIDYDAMSNTNVLDLVISESMRIHSPVGFVTRKCVRDSVLPAGNIKVEKGTKIYVPMFELHNDERYYPRPEVFDPERFSPENKHNILDATYMPFGRGSRLCLGARYGLLQAKAGIVHLIRNFNIMTVVKEEGIKYSKQQFQVRLSNFDLEFIPRDVQ